MAFAKSNSTSTNTSINTAALLFFCLLKLLFHFFLIHPAYNLHRDEYLHLDQAKHLAWGYISVPPLSSWLALLIQPFGHNENLVHLIPALAGVATVVVVWKIVQALGGNLLACCLAATAIVFSMLLRINMLFQPNSVDVLAWTAVYLGLIKFIRTKHQGWLYFTALALSFGFLNKYNIAFLIIGLGAGLILTPQRAIFSNKHFWAALLLALIVVSPNLWWQYKNHFPVIWHMNELRSTQLVNVSTKQFLLEQVLFFLTCLHLVVAGLVALAMGPRYKDLRFVLYSFLVVLILFTLLHAKAYYAVGLYPVLIAVGAVNIGNWLKESRLKKIFVPALFALNILLLIPPFLAVFPVLPPQQAAAESSRFKALGLLTWEDGKEHNLPQDFADMLGWKELAQKTDKVYRTVTDTSTTIILCNNYGQTGAINYYSNQKNIGAVSFNADYLEWFPLHKKITTIIRVCEAGEQPIPQNMTNLFTNVTLMDSVTNPLAREKGTKIYLLQNGAPAVTPLLHKMVAERRIH